MKNDMTTGSEWKKILLFSLPIMVGQLLQQLYNTVDGIVVGQFVSQAALSAVGACTSLVMLFMAIAMGLSAGVGIMVAQFYGAKRYDELRRSASTALILIGGMGVAMTCAEVFAARFLVTTVLNVEIPEIREMAITYFWIASLGTAGQFVYICVSSTLRAIGDSRATLYFLIFSAILNLVLDLIFVVIFKWGVAGAAIATALAHYVCVTFALVYMMRKYDMFRFRIRELEFDAVKAKIILRLGLPSVLQMAVMSLGHLFIQRVVNIFGEHTMAAFTVGQRIDGFLFCTVFGFNMGISTFSGQNLGAGKPERISRGWKRGMLMSGIVTSVVSLAVYIFAAPLAGLFGVSGEAMHQSVEFIRYNCSFFLIFAFNGVTTAVLQGAGDVFLATAASLTSFGIRVSSAYLLVYIAQFGYRSIWVTIPIGWGVSLIIALIRYFSGAWKKKALVSKAAAGENALESEK